jgi:hypothetical protein
MRLTLWRYAEAKGAQEAAATDQQDPHTEGCRVLAAQQGRRRPLFPVRSAARAVLQSRGVQQRDPIRVPLTIRQI